MENKMLAERDCMNEVEKSIAPQQQTSELTEQHEASDSADEAEEISEETNNNCEFSISKQKTEKTEWNQGRTFHTLGISFKSIYFPSEVRDKRQTVKKKRVNLTLQRPKEKKNKVMHDSE